MSHELVILAKASRDWKNITQYQDERGQGRRTARNGATLTSLGIGTAGTAAALSQAYPRQLGTPLQALDDVNRLNSAHKKNKKVVNRAYGGTRPPVVVRAAQTASESRFVPGGRNRAIDRALMEEIFSPELSRASSRARLLADQARAKEWAAAKKIMRRNPGPAVMAAGAGAAGVGSLMWAGGRLKARNAEHNIARLRRERSRS